MTVPDYTLNIMSYLKFFEKNHAIFGTKLNTPASEFLINGKRLKAYFKHFEKEDKFLVFFYKINSHINKLLFL
jgi:hypothetical protein